MQDPTTVTDPSTIGIDVNIAQILDKIDQIPDPAFYMALTAWLLLYVIGWFGGVKDHVKVYLITVIASTVIAIGALPVPAQILRIMMQYFSGSVIPVFIVLVSYLALIVAMAVSLYETWVVTQEEIRSDKG
ncbi:MAG: hypothetical protein DWQ05_01170 [Calditrichaeota bacterium]|nr:MAG: hypothetical protein DWQ05_01170 [Calditrichota bacterium]